MSASISGGGRGRQKSTCRKCNRTVHLVEVDGVALAFDPELITVVLFEARTPAKLVARRLHAEMCPTYQTQAELAKARAADRRRRS